MFLNWWSAALICFPPNFIWHSITKSQEENYSSIWYIWGSHSGIAEDSSLLKNYTVSFLEYLLTFRRIILPPSSVPNIWTARSWKQRHCDPSKCLYLFTTRQDIPLQKTSLFNQWLFGFFFFFMATAGFLLNLKLRWLMSYIYGAPILDVSRSHTTTQHSR